MGFILKKMYIKKFRNIEEGTINFGNKINIISGQNGAGKSNILSLIASATGMSKGQFSGLKNVSINLQPEFYNYFHINSNEDFKSYEVFSTYEETTSHDQITKELRFKDDTKQNRGIRVIPTTSPMDASKKTIFETKTAAVEYAKKNFQITYEGRIQLATQYLSISRLVPRGESDLKKTAISNRSLLKQQSENQKYKMWFNRVLNNSILEENPQMMNVRKNSTSTSSTGSIDEHIQRTSSDSISVGQDSLTHIITSLIGFDFIKSQTSYSEGILCIDEFDISLHPAAQIELLNLLDELADKLNIQIFLTTHSLTAIKELVNLQKRGNSNDYNIIYLKDREHPIITEHNDYYAVKADMYLESSVMKPKVKVYFEDETTLRFFKIMLNTAISLNTLDPNDYPKNSVQEISGHLGKSNLRWLTNVDDNFKHSTLVLDGDALYADNQTFNKADYIRGKSELPKPGNRKDYANIVRLPTPFAPESYVYYLMNYYVNGNNEETRLFWRNADKMTTIGRQFIEKNWLLNDADDIDNDVLKDDKFEDRLDKMFSFIEETDLMSFWFSRSKDRTAELIRFSKELKRAHIKNSQYLNSKLI
ncbi:AAA family ATPase [Lactiplantibacillus plantarum]|uniref:AAA family ATPase n=1 Tax=Lactiplantibacillus plantarum TaxID=1590 RepID=UPI00105902C1|nr:ATP-binding protein [Lactiplantibacillus plantarum]MDO8182118.1 AAA family ATPase [Lactiplantibacillus plantarum]QIA84105.1 hypothetical protein FEE41_02120 [Lactiplantibacillus plantarum]QVG75334.1 AAA family ATPase [Lactiplantibacillus plantarum]TDH43686.1 hypothetical protein E2I17_06380 [Lactiplantibacillus plantarum]TXJ95607.1 AAA family ATPase [Lactiplantibacillus plantarum]